MKSLSARRRHPLAALAILLVGLGAMGTLYALFAPAKGATASSASSLAIEEGRKLYVSYCSTCHGPNAEGTTDAPSLRGVGAAAVDFQVATGRMPASRPGAQIARKRPVLEQAQIDQLAAYIATLGPGPARPAPEQYAYEDLGSHEIAEGGELYRSNCSACHNASGQGGALTSGKYAPDLGGVEAKHMYQAMLTGPQSMPVFNDEVMPPEQKRKVIAFLKATEEQPNFGGLGLGRLGPVSEGLFAWIVGMGALVAVTVWIGAKSR